MKNDRALPVKFPKFAKFLMLEGQCVLTKLCGLQKCRIASSIDIDEITIQCFNGFNCNLKSVSGSIQIQILCCTFF